MHFKQLRVLVAVVECQGVTAAAERLNVSQPAVSTALRSLEEQVAATLFERFSGGRRTKPTAAGLKLYAEAKEILKRWDTAVRSLKAADSRAPALRLGVLHTLAAADVAQAQAVLAKEASNWRWQLRESDASSLASDLEQGRADLLWTVVDGTDPMSRPLWHEPYVAMVAKSHPLARSGRLSIQVQDLEGERIILRGTCELPNNTLRNAGLTIRPAARTDRDQLAMSYVARDVGYAIAPRSLATSDVVPLSVSDLGLSRCIGIRWNRSDFQDAAEALGTVLAELRR
ncbi:MAG: LysR family transcriptional regulator [Alphaproteobacteria bacterium]|nr:LysR family transcriptional regulator [Alphaproteobacteria bacterium]